MKLHISNLFKLFQKPQLSHEAEECQKFSQEFRRQLLKLKEKGLSIPIFTL